ncbi:MAG: hypothetical protein KBS93_07355 [Flavobacteriaceae bacterium]|nr:hypothetical protein [Candidatus Onthonaster equi]
MIKQDFISKYIQELAKTLAKIISLEAGNSDEGFLIIFNQMLQSYYKIDDNQLNILLEENQERDQFLLSDELRKKNILTFLKATALFLRNNNQVKAENSFRIVERIQQTNTGIFQFPTEEDQIISKEYNHIKKRINF